MASAGPSATPACELVRQHKIADVQRDAHDWYSYTDKEDGVIYIMKAGGLLAIHTFHCVASGAAEPSFVYNE